MDAPTKRLPTSSSYLKTLSNSTCAIFCTKQIAPNGPKFLLCSTLSVTLHRKTQNDVEKWLVLNKFFSGYCQVLWDLHYNVFSHCLPAEAFFYVLKQACFQRKTTFFAWQSLYRFIVAPFAILMTWREEITQQRSREKMKTEMQPKHETVPDRGG